jgi:hypothetical protein
VVLAALAADVVAFQATARPPSATAPSDKCKLGEADAHRLPVRDCLACHPFHRSHPADIDYDAFATRPSSGLRPAAEVVKRGVFLEGGRVTCFSCHDPRSRWAAHVALPPGSAVRPAVDPRDPSTYEREVPKVIDGRGLPEGTPVSPTPLCRACHTIGD